MNQQTRRFRSHDDGLTQKRSAEESSPSAPRNIAFGVAGSERIFKGKGMTWNHIADNWRQIKGRLKAGWDNLTGNDPIDGTRDQLAHCRNRNAATHKNKRKRPAANFHTA